MSEAQVMYDDRAEKLFNMRIGCTFEDFLKIIRMDF
jgi:hypothetical protein